VESADTFMQCPDDGSAGTTYAEQFGIFLSNLAGGVPITPGSFVYLKSMSTAKWCRITTVVPGSTQMQIKCDMTAVSKATKVGGRAPAFT
jgi:hypothetical protein